MFTLKEKQEIKHKKPVINPGLKYGVDKNNTFNDTVFVTKENMFENSEIHKFQKSIEARKDF